MKENAIAPTIYSVSNFDYFDISIKIKITLVKLI